MRRRDWLGRELRPDFEVIAGFGEAQLVHTLDGKLEIRGGTPADQAEARAWQEQFLKPPPPVRKPSDR